MRSLLPVLCVALSCCSQVVRYTDEIVDPNTGRKFYVTAPATAGGFVGFVVGIPVDLVALPATWLVYQVQKEQNELKADPVSTMLFPSFVLWRAGTLVALPIDLVDFTAWRAWRAPETVTREEQEEFEVWVDGQALPEYPVEQVYPPKTPAEPRAGGSDQELGTRAVFARRPRLRGRATAVHTANT